MQNSGQTTVVLFGNALDPRGRTNHPQPASPRPHGKPVAPVLAKNQPVWRSRPSKTSVTGRTQFKRRIKTQTVLPSADTAAMLFRALLASGQINMRKVDGWKTIATKPIDQQFDLAA